MRRSTPHATLGAVLKHLEGSGQTLWEYTLEVEPDLNGFLKEIWPACSARPEGRSVSLSGEVGACWVRRWAGRGIVQTRWRSCRSPS